jgi:hypothetical protein
VNASANAVEVLLISGHGLRQGAMAIASNLSRWMPSEGVDAETLASKMGVGRTTILSLPGRRILVQRSFKKRTKDEEPRIVPINNTLCR